jgi:hypothetical protein
MQRDPRARPPSTEPAEPVDADPVESVQPIEPDPSMLPEPVEEDEAALGTDEESGSDPGGDVERA